jgi:hypothetical protein
VKHTQITTGVVLDEVFLYVFGEDAV